MFMVFQNNFSQDNCIIEFFAQILTGCDPYIFQKGFLDARIILECQKIMSLEVFIRATQS